MFEKTLKQIELSLKAQYTSGYNKAIDDFAEAITNRADEESFLVTLPDGLRADVVTTDFIGDLVLEIMEKLKGSE